MAAKLSGPRFELTPADAAFPEALRTIPYPPKSLFGIGNVDALSPGLAVIGARKATPYGLGCARRFARIAAEKGLVIVSGGARGCDSEAHRAALEAGAPTVAFLGGGCDELYPAENRGLFQQIVDSGGAVVSEHSWAVSPRPNMFRTRNRLIAGLSHAVLIVEAGLPSGTFSTADEALEAGRDVLVVPGAITSEFSRGSNRLLLQGATPVIDDESFEEALFRSCGMLKWPNASRSHGAIAEDDPIIQAVLAQPSSLEELLHVAAKTFGEADAFAKLMEHLVKAEAAALIARQPDGRWAPVGDFRGGG